MVSESVQGTHYILCVVNEKYNFKVVNSFYNVKGVENLVAADR